MAETDVLILQQGLQAVDNHVADAALQLEQGQRVTDARVGQAHGDLANGQRAIVEDIHSAADNVIREVSTDTQFLAAGQQRITGDVNRGFIGSARDAASTDRNVDAAARHLDTGQRFIDQEVNRGFLGVERGLAATDRNVDNNARWMMHEDREHERYEAGEFRGLERGQRYTDEHVAKGFGHTNEHLSDAERRIDGRLAHYGEENAEAFGDAYRQAAEIERRLDNRLSDADRRTEVRLQGLAGEVARESERTRAENVRGELETRLYLRDREDRTEDMIRALADRNLDEMRGFERRSRDLAVSIDSENQERAYLNRALVAQELKTELAIERALRHRHHDDDGIRFDPRINIVLEDIDEEDRPRRRRSRESSQTV